MWGAAPRRRRYRLVVLVAFLVGLSAAPAAARVDLGAQHVASPTELWVIGVDRHNVGALTDRFALRARRARVNALVIDRRGLTRRQSKRVQRLVKRFGFRAIALPRTATMSASCAPVGRATQRHCALSGPTRSAAPAGSRPLRTSTSSSYGSSICPRPQASRQSATWTPRSSDLWRSAGGTP